MMSDKAEEKYMNLGEEYPDKYIEIEKKEFLCPTCHSPFSIAKMPDWMGADFYKDMAEYKDKIIKEICSELRAYDHSLRKILTEDQVKLFNLKVSDFKLREKR